MLNTHVWLGESKRRNVGESAGRNFSVCKAAAGRSLHGPKPPPGGTFAAIESMSAESLSPLDRDT